jgi:ribosomal protein S18 acetylase RimI-like enzyme
MLKELVSNTSVRSAKPDDVAGIVAIARAGLRAEILQLTIYGIPGVAAFLEDRLRDARSPKGDFFVLEGEDRIHGFVEIRRREDNLFLNNIYVSSSFRGQGGGTHLLHSGLERLSSGIEGHVELDVFDNNTRALSWYQRLGFECQSRSVWLESVQPMGTAKDPRDSIDIDLAEADAMQAAYGFSYFVLPTSDGPRVVGRIGKDLFRVTGPSILCDKQILEQLGIIDGKRHLLCIEPSQASNSRRDLILMRQRASSSRLRAPLRTVLRALNHRR